MTFVPFDFFSGILSSLDCSIMRALDSRKKLVCDVIPWIPNCHSTSRMWKERPPGTRWSTSRGASGHPSEAPTERPSSRTIPGRERFSSSLRDFIVLVFNIEVFQIKFS